MRVGIFLIREDVDMWVVKLSVISYQLSVKPTCHPERSEGPAVSCGGKKAGPSLRSG